MTSHCDINGRTVVPLQSKEDLTPAWLSNVLGEIVSDQHFTLQPVGTGQMSSTVRVTYQIQGKEDQETLIAKFVSADPNTKQLGQDLGHYLREAVFYRRFGKLLQAGLPVCQGAVVDEKGNFTILLEDMGKKGGFQGNNLEGCSVEQARICLDNLAKLQAPVLNKKELLEDSWLNAPSLLTQKLFAKSLPVYVERYGPSAEHQKELAWLAQNLTAWESERKEPYAIFHGDYRLDNIIFFDNECVAVDWGGLSYNSAMRDAGYFLGNGLSIEERRAHERELMKEYIGKLRQYSGQNLDFEQCFDEYRRQAYYGLTQHIIAGAVLPYMPRGEKMFKTLVERQTQHCIDLDSKSLVTPLS